MGFKEVPKGKIVPMYLTDEGDLYTIRFHDLDELDLCGVAVSTALGGRVVVDLSYKLNEDNEKISIYNLKKGISHKN